VSIGKVLESVIVSPKSVSQEKPTRPIAQDINSNYKFVIKFSERLSYSFGKLMPHLPDDRKMSLLHTLLKVLALSVLVISTRFESVAAKPVPKNNVSYDDEVSIMKERSIKSNW
jgi:hypothetical protein